MGQRNLGWDIGRLWRAGWLLPVVWRGCGGYFSVTCRYPFPGTIGLFWGMKRHGGRRKMTSAQSNKSSTFESKAQYCEGAHFNLFKVMTLEKQIKNSETVSLEKYPCARIHVHTHTYPSAVVQEAKLRNSEVRHLEKDVCGSQES